MNRTEFVSYLRDLDACVEALAWIEQTSGEPADLWAACTRGDWMIWLLAKVSYDERVMRHIACDCATDVLPIYERYHPDSRRLRDCITMARRYADGEATEEEKAAAWAAAADAAEGAAWAAARDAACSAAYAADWIAAGDATLAAAGAATGAVARNAAWDAARNAAGDVARNAAWARQADMIRARVSWADVERAMTEFMARKGKE